MAKEFKNLQDAQKAFNELYNWVELHKSKDWNFNGLRITNASDGVDPQDYVTLRQLKNPANSQETGKGFYTIVLSKDGQVVTAENSPAFIVGNNREGIPTQAWVCCEPGFEPSGGDLTINISYTRYDPDGTGHTVNLLASDLHLPNGTSNRVFTSTFISPTPKLSNGSKINKIIVAGNNASYVSIGLVVKLL